MIWSSHLKIYSVAGRKMLTCHVLIGAKSVEGAVAPGTKLRKCTVCNGQGQTRRVYSQNRFSTIVTMEP